MEGSSIETGAVEGAVAETSPEELQRILAEQRRELEWWGDQPAMESAEDIRAAIERGDAAWVPAEGVGYKISAKVPEEFRALDADALATLQGIAAEWKEGMKDDKLFLVVSSLARTLEYQQQLIARGYPAAENSTHTKLGAFDIATRWLEENRPDALAVLEKVIAARADRDELNFIREPEVGAWHVAVRRA